MPKNLQRLNVCRPLWIGWVSGITGIAELDSSPEPRVSSGNERDLLNEPVGKTLILFSLPALAVNILHSLNGSVNAIWVGQLLGEEALAATSNGGLIMFMAIAAMFGFSMAATILIGQAAGRGDLRQVREIFGGAVGIFIISGIATVIVGWMFIPEMLSMLAIPAGAYELAEEYMPLIFLGLPITFMMILLSAALRGVGDAVTPLWSTAVNVGLCILLNPLFILGYGPIPAMGVAGAALAMLIAGLVSMLYLVQRIYAKDLAIRLRGAELSYLRPSLKITKLIFGMGTPIGMSMIIMSLSGLVMFGLINREGVNTAAAYGVMSQLWNYVMLPSMAVSGAVSAMAAQNIGAGKWHRVSRITGMGILVNVAMSAILVAALTIFIQPLLWLFLDADSPAIPIAVHINYWVGWTYIVMGISMVATSVVRANGAVIVPLIFLTISMILVRLGIGFGLYPSYGADAIWSAFGISTVLSAMLGLGYYLHGGWRNRKPLTPDMG